MTRFSKMTVEEKNAYAEKMWAKRDKQRRKAKKPEDIEYLAAQLKAAGWGLTPIGAITGWGQGDLNRLNAERRQKAEMEKLIAAVKESKQAPQIAFKYCSQCGAKVPLTANFCGSCGKAIVR